MSYGITILTLPEDCKGIFHKKVAQNDIKQHYFDTESKNSGKYGRKVCEFLCFFFSACYIFFIVNHSKIKKEKKCPAM
ncbi:MAG: hypothetical protein IKC08_01005 [Lentisphaeria bacterium]|nr:hypothetical protein [Lentisphaeria bacterium]